MVKLDVPIKVTLSNGRTFHAKYKRIKINLLADNIRIRWRYWRRWRNNQQGCGFKDVLKKGFNLTKLATRCKIGWSLAKIAFENLPEPYKKEVGKIKNQKVQKILNSDFVNRMIDYGQAYACIN